MYVFHLVIGFCLIGLGGVSLAYKTLYCLYIMIYDLLTRSIEHRSSFIID